ncbi:MAG: hypothetical protein MHM6MM_007988, partial [Cercozoa sp. M6MM]
VRTVKRRVSTIRVACPSTSGERTFSIPLPVDDSNEQQWDVLYEAARRKFPSLQRHEQLRVWRARSNADSDSDSEEQELCELDTDEPLQQQAFEHGDYVLLEPDIASDEEVMSSSDMEEEEKTKEDEKAEFQWTLHAARDAEDVAVDSVAARVWNLDLFARDTRLRKQLPLKPGALDHAFDGPFRVISRDRNNRRVVLLSESTGHQFRVYSCVLNEDNSIPHTPTKGIPSRGKARDIALKEAREHGDARWVLIGCMGGRFSAVELWHGQSRRHKSFHRYVVRAKQGKRQASVDKSAGRKIKSAGSWMRRYHESQLREEVSELLSQWRQANVFSGATKIFVFAPGAINKRLVFDTTTEKDKTIPLRQQDSKVFSLPFAVGRRCNRTALLAAEQQLSRIEFLPHPDSIDSQRAQELYRRSQPDRVLVDAAALTVAVTGEAETEAEAAAAEVDAADAASHSDDSDDSNDHLDSLVAMTPPRSATTSQASLHSDRESDSDSDLEVNSE